MVNIVNYWGFVVVLVLFHLGMTAGQVLKFIHSLCNYNRKYPRWLMTNFLSVALWVIFDQEGNILFVARRVHYGSLCDT